MGHRAPPCTSPTSTHLLQNAERTSQGSCAEACNDLNFTAGWVGAMPKELVSGTAKKLQFLFLSGSSSQDVSSLGIQAPLATSAVRLHLLRHPGPAHTSRSHGLTKMADF